MYKDESKKKEYSKRYYLLNREKILLRTKNYKKTEKYKLYQKEYDSRLEVKLKRKIYTLNSTLKRKEYRLKNKLIIKQKRQEYYLKNKDRINLLRRNNKANNIRKLEYMGEYNSKPEVKLRLKIWGKLNRKRISEQEKIKRQKDISFKIKKNLRRRLNEVIKLKTNSYSKLLDCTFNEFRIYIESKFKEGMTWDNYGFKGWHIDHIVPCCKFDLTLEEEQKKCFNYLNLQPLWWYENLRKPRRLFNK